MARAIGNDEIRNLILYAMREEMTDVDSINITTLADTVYKQNLKFDMTKEEFLDFMNGGDTPISLPMMASMVKLWGLDNDSRLDYLFAKHERS